MAVGVLSSLLNLPKTPGSLSTWWRDVFRTRWWLHRAGPGHSMQTDPLVQGGHLSPESMQFVALAELAGMAAMASAKMEDMICMCLVISDSMLDDENIAPARRLLRKVARKQKQKKHANLDVLQERKQALEAWMRKSGSTIILHLERFPACIWEQQNTPPQGLPWRKLQADVAATMGYPQLSLHIYTVQAGGQQALHFHADSDDVIVVQLEGSKSWEVCTPFRAPARRYTHAHIELLPPKAASTSTPAGTDDAAAAAAQPGQEQPQHVDGDGDGDGGIGADADADTSLLTPAGIASHYLTHVHATNHKATLKHLLRIMRRDKDLGRRATPEQDAQDELDKPRRYDAKWLDMQAGKPHIIRRQVARHAGR